MSRRRRSQTARVKIFDAHGGICHICGLPIEAGQKWDISHLIALAAGGEDTDENCRPAHAKCHRGKGSQTALEDMPRIAKTKRQRAAHIGAKVPKQTIQSRNDLRTTKRARDKSDPFAGLPPAPLMRSNERTDA